MLATRVFAQAMAQSKYLSPNKREVLPTEIFFTTPKQKAKTGKAFAIAFVLCAFTTPLKFFPVHMDRCAISLTHCPMSSSTLIIFAFIPLKLPAGVAFVILLNDQISEILNSNILLFLFTLNTDCIFQEGCNKISHPTCSSLLWHWPCSHQDSGSMFLSLESKRVCYYGRGDALPPEARSFKVIPILYGLLSTFILWTPPPCYEAAQTTERLQLVL